VRQNLSHLNLNNFHEIISLVNSSNLTIPPASNFTPEQNGLWYNISTGESQPHLDSSFWCVDFETIENTKVLVMGSAWDLLNQEWWCFISRPGTNPRVETKGKHLIVAHRSTFELGFYKEAYSLDCQIRFLDTHTMAAQRYHPAQVGLYRAQPWLPMFRESCDLSLAELSLTLCGRSMDKSDVDVFIDASVAEDVEKGTYEEGEWCWRVSCQKISKNCKTVFARTLKIQQKLGNFVGFTDWKELMFFLCPTGLLVDMAETDLEILDKPSKKFLDTKKLHWLTPDISKLCLYNQTDVSCTMGVFANMWEWYRELPYEHIAGLYHRSIPLLPLASDWFEKVASIDRVYQERLAKMVVLVDKIEQEYLTEVGENDWDLLDWGCWSNSCKDKSKVGKIKWLGGTGLSSKKLMRIARLSWQGRPMFVQTISKTDKKGEVVLKKDGEEREMMGWYTCNPHPDGWLAAIKLKRGIERLDNPTNTTGEIKDIVTVFSKTFIPFWDSGKLTSESLHAQEIAKTCASISFWNSFRDRVFNKMMIFNTGFYQALALRTLVSGAISGRAIDNIGLVLSNPKESKVGSELGGHFCCPDGYKFVFADFDSIQAVIIALYAAIAEYKQENKNRDLIDPLNNVFSQSTLVGEKKTKSTLAWLLAKKINPNWEVDWALPDRKEGESVEDYKKRCEKVGASEYALGKTVQYAMLFGAGLGKLIVICGSESVARSILEYFKGVFNKQTRKYEGGIASVYFNYCQELATGTINLNGRFRKIDTIQTSFLGRELPLILKPSNRGKDLSMTAMNVVTQAIDVDCLNYIVNGIISQCDNERLAVRYSTTVHDSFYLIVKDEDCPRVKEIFQEQHETMYRKLLAAFHIDAELFPKSGLRYSGVDVNARWTKGEGDLGKTVSNLDGYDYDTTASFIYGDAIGGAVFAEDYQSSSALIKYYKGIETVEEMVGVEEWVK
jgi:hypothetical protein